MASLSSVASSVRYVVLYPLIAMIAIMGNGLVLYAAYRKNNPMKFSVYQDMDIVIKSLAITDLLIGLVGIPARILAFWMEGKLDLDEDHNEGTNCRILQYFLISIYL